MKKFIGLFVLSFLVLASCRMELDPLPSVKGGSKKKTEKVREENKNCVDPGYFFDVTLKQNSAYAVSSEKISEVCEGRYVKGDSSITVSGDRVLLICESIESGKYKGCSFVCDYEYTLKAAGRHVMYLCPKRIKQIMINDTEVSKGLYSDFYTYIPLYGFGENRIEVSSVMDGVIALPSGTYWAR